MTSGLLLDDVGTYASAGSSSADPSESRRRAVHHAQSRLSTRRGHRSAGSHQGAEVTYESGSLLVLYTDGLIEYSHDAQDGEARLLRAARDAVTTKAQHPAKFIVESVLQEEARYPDDVAVLTIFFE
jgi:hypothetical protein